MGDVRDKPTILVVDDEEDVVEVLRLHMPNECQIRTAFDGAEAIEEAGAGVDLVLLDRRLPEHSGDEVLEKLRASDHEFEVVLVSAVEEEYGTGDLDYDAYISKPFTADEVQQTVSCLLPSVSQ